MGFEWNTEFVKTPQFAAAVLNDVRKQLEDVGVTTSLVSRFMVGGTNDVEA
jgi:hypothetical protein